MIAPHSPSLQNCSLRKSDSDSEISILGEQICHDAPMTTTEASTQHPAWTKATADNIQEFPLTPLPRISGAIPDGLRGAPCTATVPVDSSLAAKKLVTGSTTTQFWRSHWQNPQASNVDADGIIHLDFVRHQDFPHTNEYFAPRGSPSASTAPGGRVRLIFRCSYSLLGGAEVG